MTDAAAQPGQSRDAELANGFVATTYVPLGDVIAEDADLVLSALTRARIAAYLLSPHDGVIRVFVDAQERADARSIMHATGARSADPREDLDAGALEGADPQAGSDTDALFAELTSDWHVDTVAAIRAAERQLAQDEAERLAQLPPPIDSEPDPEDIEHYVAPPPPPLPRISGATIRGLLVILVGIAVLAFGDLLQFDPNFTLLLGVAGILLGAGMLVMRLRPHSDDDDPDDGAVL
ncbi:hypothetical protein SAMN05892883_3556 [Jatrophihabitans sp. GAS493]|uniref:hypothetical protein n=1 Tax=Jatrophihabitans sp. GAS493 TaxID=1907575 RepID=UPI000BB8241F|nr:hypothetical protein [Jatrophihabitans sp. GAS493]SOD74372.1 hypothetical protein SAMN05892883_3556 [Jatrophihabitans sp. GAS493]